MYNNVQAICAGLARSGCLILCYIHVAEKITGEQIDVLRATLHLAQMGYIKLEKGKEQAEDAFTVLDGEKVIEDLTHQKRSVTKVGKLPENLENKYVIKEYVRYVGKKRIQHFSCDDFKPLANSQTEKYGEVLSYRLIE